MAQIMKLLKLTGYADDNDGSAVCCYNYCWSDSECRINLVGLSIKVCEKASWNLIYTKEQMKRNEMSEMILIIFI
jgi:hypothetical protein